MALFEWTLALLLGAVILTGLARRVGVPYPSLLAIAGAALAFAPAGPELEIEPDLALALFVAPALLDAAFDTSPRDLRRNVIPLASLVVVAVGLTTAAVAWVGWRLGGLPIAAAVALGAIVAPPDAAAAAAVFGRLRLPRRILHVLQGESLLNDATALLVYRIAVGAAVGTVTLGHTGPIVALMAVGSPLAGWLLARLYLLGTARVRDAASFTVLTFVGTFGVWLLAARVGLSPIITMVTYGMALSREASRRATARNRISTYSVWETAVFVLNVLAFVIMGLQARPILNRLSGEHLSHALLVSGAVLATVIVVRIAYVMTYSALARTSRQHAGGARHSRGRALARGGGRPRRVPRRARGGRESGGAPGRDRARPAPRARDHGPAADAAPAARGGRDRRRGISPAGGGGRLGRARCRPGRVLPAAHDGRRGAGPSDVTSSYSFLMDTEVLRPRRTYAARAHRGGDDAGTVSARRCAPRAVHTFAPPRARTCDRPPPTSRARARHAGGG